ncbi:ribosome biogenesis protein NOP53-like [Oscarella lobularis]|uniref:ribosome biogenesis protein NOP53-like n=1 Tax=Oscarella lobularis TaxID=121494 RepID=UPI0033140625
MGRKRVSKKSKRSWRKHTDIADVEDYLDEARAQERTTGGLVAEQANDALFFVDKGEFDIRDGGNDRDRVLFAGTEPPSAKRPKIAVSSKSTKDEDATARKAETKTKTIRAVVKSKRPKRRKDHVSEDLWKDKATEPPDPIDEYYREVTRQRPVKAPTTMKLNKPLPVAAVEVAAAGASYNPSFESHQKWIFIVKELLKMATENAVKKLKKDQKAQRKLGSLKTTTSDEREAIWLNEMTSSNREDEEAIDSSGDVVSRGDPSQPKTRKQRRKERERKEANDLVKKERNEKQRMQDVYRIKALKREIRDSEEKSKVRMEEKKRKEEINKTKPKRLGSVPYEEPPVVVQLPEELSGSLRKLKPKGSIAFDRKGRKYPLKYYTRKGHRDEDFSTM